jgi:hypothetical protein
MRSANGGYVDLNGTESLLLCGMRLSKRRMELQLGRNGSARLRFDGAVCRFQMVDYWPFIALSWDEIVVNWDGIVV